MGLERLWMIPRGVLAADGRVRALRGRRAVGDDLPGRAPRTTPSIVGENLGTVPPCDETVPFVVTVRSVCGSRSSRFPRDVADGGDRRRRAPAGARVPRHARPPDVRDVVGRDLAPMRRRTVLEALRAADDLATSTATATRRTRRAMRARRDALVARAQPGADRARRARGSLARARTPEHSRHRARRRQLPPARRVRTRRARRRRVRHGRARPRSTGPGGVRA